MMKKLVCIYSSYVPSDFYGRDPFLVPYYIGLKHGFSVSIVYHGKKGQKKERHSGVDLVPLFFKGKHSSFSFRGEWYFFWWIFRNARKIDCLILFHFSYQTTIIGWIYKRMNPKGFFYTKCDGWGAWYALFREKAWFKETAQRNQRNILTRIKNRIIHSILQSMCKTADKISIELPECYEYLSSDPVFKRYPDKLKLMFNGIDERALASYQIKELDICEKENIILSVGRHGCHQKNTGMFLKALSLSDLKNWKVLFIGTIEEKECRFQDEIDDFFEKNPSMKGKVEFIGPVYDRKRLYEYYNRAKVFVHTAVYESYGIVLGEAFRFRNYLISTPAGIAPPMIKYGYGRLCEHNDAAGLARVLQEVIDGKIDLEEQYRRSKIPYKKFSYDNEIDKLGDFEL